MILDVIQPARSREDDVHNVQVVIDTLSLDILNTSMTHITGESVVDGDQQAIANLLDVLCGLMEFLLDKIGSDISSTDNDGELPMLYTYTNPRALIITVIIFNSV